MSVVLVISSGNDRASALAEWIREPGRTCHEVVKPGLFAVGRDAVKLSLNENPDCIVLVADPEGEANGRVLKHLRLAHLAAGIVAVGGSGGVDARHIEDDGADARLKAEVGRVRFLVAVQRTLDLAKLRSELQYLRCKDATGADFGQLVGSCQAMRAILTQVLTLCRRTTNVRGPAVLITGETGTGKGQIARAIHHNGTRRDKPMVEVNCASLLENLMESELFGAQKGAYTGADESRTGLFEVANSGTIFLDEIGTLNLDLQAKLLRVLDESTIRRVGSTVERTLDVQVICATHRDLKAAVRMGEFREDLYYRLSVIHMELPPLRDRDQDVVLLAENFLGQLSAEYGGPPLTLSPDSVESLLAYDWPGNVRELRNRLERVVLLCDIQTIEPEHLELPADPASVLATGTEIKVEIPPGGVSLAAVEKAFIDEAMRMSEGNVAKAARLLNLSRSTLRYRLKQ
jgi:two-component system, NtrC family, response regulator AtoC